MPDLTIPFTDEQFRLIAAEALTKALPDAARERLIQDALTAAMRPQGYGSTSLVEAAFRRAIESHVMQAVQEIVAKDERVMECVRAEARVAVERLLASKDFTIAAAMARAIQDGLQKVAES